MKTEFESFTNTGTGALEQMDDNSARERKCTQLKNNFWKYFVSKVYRSRFLREISSLSSSSSSTVATSPRFRLDDRVGLSTSR